MHKSIEIDSDAYDRLEKARRAEETVSEVILRYVKPPRTAEEVLEILQSADISDQALDAIDESLTRRRAIPRNSRQR